MKLLPTLFVATAFAASAHAADQTQQSGEWSLLQDANGQAVYSTEVGAPALVLGCNADGKISATFSLEGDVTNNLESGRDRPRTVNATLQVEGKDAAKSKWVYLSKRNMAAPLDTRFARRIYNAAVTGSTISLDLGRRGTYEYAPPKMNGDFKTFASACSA